MKNTMLSLFISIYRWQLRVGNDDIPVFMSLSLICFSMWLYGFSVLCMVDFIFRDYWMIGSLRNGAIATTAICVAICTSFYYIKLHNRDIGQLVRENNISKCQNVLTAGFVIGSILSVCAVFLIMCAGNNNWI